ncbi:TrmB family transcriptional regulator [Ammoniphilus sp. CFH 90114]|uniref:TrmB family transcriptional regulator n=1 Tax=Ammoniphilus sp. CFH 90114 TaxID=2493665 RepID=UPI00100E6042|nr:TrmB family transcriptional regulator [Ammoniphilus sp. CFH 90114]RXT15427.1 TrmB family transcriptional regulator [Ammoniphilus sp. CFH 90114]
MELLFSELQKLGFSQYESKAYVALLQNSPVTGYEVSKRSGVPRSMIYEVLGKLVDRGAVYLVPSEPVKYAPVPAKDMLQRMRNNLENSMAFLETTLESLERKPDLEVIVHLDGEEQVLQEMTDVIGRTQEELWISVWEPQVERIKRAVEEQVSKEVSVYSIVFGGQDQRIRHTYHHNYMPPEVVQKRMGGQLTIVARDGEEVVIANFSDQSVPWAVKTKNPALVLVATEYVRHDIMIEEITREFGEEKLDQLWRNRPDLYQVVTGKRFNL